ncbi:MAG: hypothetical protein M1142_02805 [Patescibacteria group bacterium]|nr:hypothetical protein [Patescibacteria group bacterium]
MNYGFRPEQTPAMYAIWDMSPGAEILNYLKPFTNKEGRSDPQFTELFQDLFNRVQTPPRGKMNFVVSIGAPAWGKTDTLNQFMNNFIYALMEPSMEEVDNQDWIVPYPGSRNSRQVLVYYRLLFINMIRTAEGSNLVESKELGRWSPDDFDIITNVGFPAVEIAKNGMQPGSLMPTIDRNHIGITALDFPAMTASGVSDVTSRTSNGYSYLGSNRGFTLIKHLCSENPKNVTVYALLTDAKSEARRLSKRSKLPPDATPKEIGQWLDQDMNIEVTEEALQKMADYPISFGTLYTATESARQNAWLILELDDRGEIKLDRIQREIVKEEFHLLDSGHHNLLSPQVQEIRDDVIYIIGDKFFPHLFASLGMPEKRWFRFWNKDIGERIQIPFSDPKDFSLIDKINHLDSKMIPALLHSRNHQYMF